MTTSRIPDSRLYGAVFEDMEAFPERMRDNTDLLGGLPLSERVMLALGEEVGERTAHEIVHEVAMAARREGAGFREELGADPRAAPYLGPEAIRALLDPCPIPRACRADRGRSDP